MSSQNFMPVGDLRERGHRARAEVLTDEAVAVMAPRIGTRAACRAAGVAQATWHRRHRISPPAPKEAAVPHKDRIQPRALTAAERAAILNALHSERFADLAPDEVWATLLDEGAYLCSWDITKLHGPAKWTYYHLYVILDIYSRYAVGWMAATRESAVLAEKLISETCAKQGITRGQLSLHADRGSSVTSKPVALLLADLGITQSHSRPHVSNDNPYSEAAFKTLKYRPAFPARFASVEAARAHCQDFFRWYNNEHRHGGLGLHTAADVHHGHAPAVQAGRAQVLDAAYQAHPERFVSRPPTPPALPVTSWINPPQEKEPATQ
jgi:putative transposase